MKPNYHGMNFLWNSKKAEDDAARDALVIDAIMEWAYSLPEGAAEVIVSKDVVTVVPTNPRAAGFAIFPEHDTEFNLVLAGRQMYPRFDAQLAVKLFVSLAEGRCQRTVWERAGKALCARTEFLDSVGLVIYTYQENGLWPWSRPEPPRLIKFEAY